MQKEEQIGKLEDDWNGLQMSFLRTCQLARQFFKFIILSVTFDIKLEGQIWLTWSSDFVIL